MRIAVVSRASNQSRSSVTYFDTPSDVRRPPRACGVLSRVTMIFILSLWCGPALDAHAEDTILVAEGSQNEVAPAPALDTASVDSTVFDLYLSDDFSGAVVASFTDDWCEIDDPQDAVAQLSALQGQTAKLSELLSGRIEKRREIPGLGSVICFPQTFRIVVIPDAAFLKSAALQFGKKIGKPDSGFSLHQTLGTAVFRDQEAQNSSALTHRGLASYGDIFFRANGFKAQDNPYQINEATLGTIVGDYQARAGLLQMRGLAFTPSLRFAGLQFETAQEIFLDDDAAKGSKLEVFIPSRATVQFYRDGQLLSVQLLDFGLQEVNTSSFPQGSYDVDIVIIDSNGQETRERRFYTKAGFLASRARPVFFLSGGAVRTTFDVLDTPLVQAGMKMRLSDFFDTGLAFAATDNKSLANIDINGLYDTIQVRTSGALTPDGEYGLLGNLGFNLLGFSIGGQTVYADGEDRQQRQGDPDPLQPPPSDFIPQLAVSPVDLYLQTQRSNALNVARALGPVTLRYNVQRNKVGDSNTRYAHGPIVDWNIVSIGNSQLTLRGSDLQTDQGLNRSLQLFHRQRLSREWGLTSQLMRRWQEDQDEYLFVLGVAFSNQPLPSATGIQLQASEEARRLNNPSGESVDTLTSNVFSVMTGEYIRGSSFVRDSRVRGADGQTALGLNTESAFFVSGDGGVELARPPQSESVFVAEVTGNALSVTDRFDVMVNDQKQGEISSDDRAIVSLQPYKSYKINIIPQEGSSLVDYDTATYEVTMFPGNVVKRTWQVDKVFVLLGRLLDENGEPVAHERIRGAKGYGLTEADGSFQLEITGLEPLSIKSKRRDCVIQVKLPEQPPEYLFDAGDVICSPVTSADSPG